MSFFGITDVQSIVVEGMSQMPNEAEPMKENAIAKTREVAKNLVK